MLEATTNTWAVVDVLKPFVAAIATSNPLRTKAIAQAKVKTDKVDAEVLAQLLRCGNRTRRPACCGSSPYRAGLVGDRMQIKNRLKGVLNQRLIKPSVKHLYSVAGLKWLRELPLSAGDRMVVDGQLRLLESIEAQGLLLDRQLRQLAHREDQAKLLMTLPGVGHGTALCLLASLGDISSFRDGDHAPATWPGALDPPVGGALLPRPDYQSR